MIVVSLVISCAEKPGNATQEKASEATISKPVKGSITFDNADFYSEQGEFLEGVANVHSAAHVRHSDEHINAQFLGG